MKTHITRANERGTKDIGWLQSNFTFSFSSYANPLRNGFGLLRVFNDDYMQVGGGFGIHPHVNIEIISIMLAGKMNHKDSMGYSEVVDKDWVQIMSAGTGLRHEEHNVGDEAVNFLQIWIEPKLQNIMPRYQRRKFPEEKRKNQLVAAVTNEEGQSHCWINQNAKILLGYFEAGQQVPYETSILNRCQFLFLISGKVEVGGQTLPPRLDRRVGNRSFSVNCLEESRFVLIDVPVNH